MSGSERFPLLRVMGSNAFLLSAVYLGFGVLVEAGRRFLSGGTVLGQLSARMSLILDALPAQILERVGLLERLRIQYLDGELSEPWIRLAFGLTTVTLIFALALATGGALAGLRRLALRHSEERA